MGFNARPSAANSRRSRVQTSTYSNSSYSNLPATSFATEHSRSRLPRYNHTVAQGIHLASHSLKVPSRGVVQPRHGTRPQSHYPYTPADATPQNWNGQELLSGRDHQKRQARDRERSAPINNFPSASPDATVKHAVAMAFVPEQPAKRAIAFESSLFQRNDPSVALPQSYQRTPLSELNLSSSILLPRYPNSPPPKYAPCQEKPPSKSTYNPPEESRVKPPPRPLSALSSTPSRMMHTSEHYPYPHEKGREVVDKAPSNPRRLSRASVLSTRPTKK